MPAFTTVDGRLSTGGSARIHVTEGLISGIEYLVGHDAADVMMAPGLIDLQVNGCAGVDVNADDIDADRITALTHEQWDRGVARYCPTIVTAPEDRIVAVLRAVVQARAQDALVRQAIPGVHVEGPHISPDDGPRGAHDLRYVRSPDIAEFQRWQRAAEGIVRIVTVAPETASSAEYIAAVTRSGTLVSIGHTAADEQAISRACDAGATLSTHLGNAIHQRLARHPNPIWTQLSEDRLTASFIADGHHLPASALIAMVRAKGRGRSLLVSDSTRLTDCAPGDYDEAVGGGVTLHPNGKLTLRNSSAMAGSAMSLDQCVAWAAVNLDCGLRGVLEMASDTPARLLGLRRLAGFEIGVPADITFYHSNATRGFMPVATMLGGNLVAGDLDSP